MNVRLLKTPFLTAITRTTIILLLLTSPLSAQKIQSLPRGTPEAAGISSAAILDFMDAFKDKNMELHSFMILRHGKVIAEAWNKPYAADLKHSMYSVSKSFTATAVGFAVAEKKLTVNDQVISFFPDDLPEQPSPHLLKLKIKDLLTMSVGQENDPIFEITTADNWIKAFLNKPIIHEPGTKFLYNSMATYVLSAIVQKVTGEKILDYLKPRLFDPLGIQNIDWETDPRGIHVGGWGLRLKTEDMAKFGQLFLQKGVWQGKQILPASWVAEASTLKIEQAPDATAEQKATNDWLQGYGYQMWRNRHHSYRADGAFGQFIIVLPAQDAVIVMTAETADMQSEINLVWQYLWPAFQSKPLPADVKMHKLLRDQSNGLALPVANGRSADVEKQISGKTFDLQEPGKLKSIGFQFINATCQLTLQTDTAEHQLVFGNGKWAHGITTKKGPNLVAVAKGSLDGLQPFKVAGSYHWKDAGTLELTLRYVESPHTETIRCTFNGDQVLVDVETIFNRSDANRPILKGILHGDQQTR